MTDSKIYAIIKSASQEYGHRQPIVIYYEEDGGVSHADLLDKHEYGFTDDYFYIESGRNTDDFNRLEIEYRDIVTLEVR